MSGEIICMHSRNIRLTIVLMHSGNDFRQCFVFITYLQVRDGRNRWLRIESALKHLKISSASELVMAIKTYYKCDSHGEVDVQYDWGIDGLTVYFDKVLAERSQKFFAHTLPFIIDLALELPRICSRPIRLLRKQVIWKHSIDSLLSAICVYRFISIVTSVSTVLSHNYSL
jgi:Poly (ADP-ribose) glycohydrolase (PARG)